MQAMEKSFAKQRVGELEKICRLRPNSLNLADLAAVYFTLDQPEKALNLAEVSWAQNKNPSVGMNLSLIYKDLGMHDKALATVQESFWLNPDDPYIRMGYGEALLKAGFWEQAWSVYDNSRPTQLGAALYLGLPASIQEWDGSGLPEDHQLIVINEGGTGDRISYARWLHELTDRGINWKFYPFEELFSFFERVFPRDRLLADGDQMDPDPTHWVTTFSLPAKLKAMPGKIPPPLKFTASPEAIKKYELARKDDLPIVGLCYEAAELFQGGRRVRSMSEGQAMRLVCQTGDKVHWINLQHDKEMPYPVSNIPFKTWEDTAGLIHNLDAVVTVDTGTMHLAGALNKKMSVILSANSCWKFLREGKKLSLYPSATFYRNETHGVENAITALVADIRNGIAFHTQKF